MNANVRDCAVQGYHDLIDGLDLPDPNDRHVWAAAIRAHADVILTFNLEDFPADELAEYGIEAQHPDEFIEHLIDLNQAKVCATVKRSFAKPAKFTKDTRSVFGHTAASSLTANRGSSERLLVCCITLVNIGA